MTITTSGGFKFSSNLPNVRKELQKVYVRNLQSAVTHWHSALLKVMSGRRTGKVRRVPGTIAATYTSSNANTNPPEPPAVRLGILRASYMTSVDPKALSAYLGTDLDYGVYLERGTKFMIKRPAIEPAFERAKDKIIQSMVRGV